MKLAVVIAGGRSRRFGSEKAMAVVDGKPLIERAIERLSAQGYETAVNAPRDSGAAAWAHDQGLRVISDDAADPAGPLAGLKAGLLWAQGRGAQALATAPCDTPNLPPDLELRLADALEDFAGAAVASSSSGLQSLCAIWRVDETLSRLEAHFSQGRHPAVHDLLAELGATQVAFDSDAPFANLNRPEDLQSTRREGASFDRPATQAAQDDDQLS